METVTTLEELDSEETMEFYNSSSFSQKEFF